MGLLDRRSQTNSVRPARQMVSYAPLVRAGLYALPLVELFGDSLAYAIPT